MKQTIEIEVPEGYKAIFNPDTKKVDIVKVCSKPKTWKEFCEGTYVRGGEAYIDTDSAILTLLEAQRRNRNPRVDKNLCTSAEEAKAFLALMQLRQLRKAWVGDWEPDWNNCDNKYCILFEDEYVRVDWLQHCSTPLSFPTKEMAKEFLEYFKDLIEKAKVLL